MELRVFARGEQDGPAVMLVHGLLGTSRNLMRLQERLTGEGYRTLAYDQRGHGHSPWATDPSGYALGRLAEDLLEVLDQHAIPAAHLVGHSLGGRVCLLAASRAPQRALSVGLLDVGARIGTRAFASLHAILDLLPPSFSSRDEARRFLDENLPLPVRQKKHYAQFLASNLRSREDRLEWIFDLEGIRAGLLDSLKENHFAEWRALRCPSLVARGSDSEHFTVDEQEELLRENPTARAAVIERAGHWIHVDNLEGTFQAYRDFLREAR